MSDITAIPPTAAPMPLRGVYLWLARNLYGRHGKGSMIAGYVVDIFAVERPANNTVRISSIIRRRYV
jgi:hypothetical protein